MPSPRLSALALCMLAACDTPEPGKTDGPSTGDTGADCEPATWYEDRDGDGVAGTPVEGCDAPEGAATEPLDCDDGDPAVHPGANEACDGLDDDCDGEIDEGCPDEPDEPPCPVHVAQDADPDVADGSEAHPFARIQDALDARGACLEVSLAPDAHMANLILRDDGLTLARDADADPALGPAVLLQEDPGTVIHIDGASGVHLQGIAIVGSYDGTPGLLDDPEDEIGGGVLITGASDVVLQSVSVQACDLDRGHGAGIAVMDSEGVLFDGVGILDNDADGAGGGLWVRDSQVDVRDSFVEGNDAAVGGGLYLEGWTGTVSDTSIRYNSAEREGGGEAEGHGRAGGVYVGPGSSGELSGNELEGNLAWEGGGAVLLDGAVSMWVVGNTFVDDLGGGVHSEGASGVIASNVLVGQHPDALGFSGASDQHVVHNTIVSSDEVGIQLRPAAGADLQLTLDNNLITEAGLAAMRVDPEGEGLGSGDDVRLQTNLVWGEGEDYEGHLVGLDAATASGTRVADPQLAGVGAGDWCPDAASPAVDAATPDPDITHDLDGTPRTLGAGPDIGAVECH